MERVKIAEIDIGVDKLVAKAGQVKKELNQIKEEQKKLNKETGNLTKANQEQLNQFTRNEVEIKNLNKQFSNSTKVMDAYINIQNQDIRTKDQARNANLKLIAIANQLDATNEDQAKLLKKVNAEVDANTDFLKENSSEYEKTKINIGNYKEAITGALGELGIFGNAQGTVNSITKATGPIINFVSTNLKQVKDDYKKTASETYGMSKAQVAAHLTSTTLSSGLKILKIALAATGIGLVVLALGSLITYFATTQEGINKVNKVLTPLKVVFSTMLGVIQKFGKELFDAFSNPQQLIKDVGEAIKQNLINRFLALGKMITAVMNGDVKGMKDAFLQGATGVEDVTGKISKMGAEAKKVFDEAIDRANKIEAIKQNLSKTEADFIAQQAKLNKKFEQQKKLSDDINKPIKDREAAAQKAIEAQEKLSKGAIERINQEAEILSLKQESSDTSDTEKADLARKVAEVDKALQEEAAKTTELQNKKNAIVKEGSNIAIASRQKVVQNTVASLNSEIALYEEQNRLKQKTDEQQLNHLQNLSAKKLEVLKFELSNKLISKKEYQTESLKLENDLIVKRAEIAQGDLQRIEDFQNRKKTLEDQLYLDSLATQKERDQAKLDMDFADKESEIERLVEDHGQRTELLLLLEEERKNRLAELNQKYADQSILDEKKRANEEIQVRQDLSDARVNIAKGLLGILSAVAGDNAKIQIATLLLEKGIAATQVILQTQIANAKALAASPLTFGQPFVGYNLIQMGLSLGTIAAQTFSGIKSINKKSAPKAAQGFAMDINGPSHSQGGSTFYDANGNPLVEAQGGEKMVILKREASKELSVLSALNQKHGGVNLSTPVTYANNGGAVSRRPSGTSIKIPKNIIDYDLLAYKMAEANSTLPRPVVDVKDINSQQYNLATVNNRANL